MQGGPSLIFDKSSLESLSLDEAVLMDNFYMSNITPLFYVECMADLEKQIGSNSTQEGLRFPKDPLKPRLSSDGAVVNFSK
jgi:hypothetical protein